MSSSANRRLRLHPTPSPDEPQGGQTRVPSQPDQARPDSQPDPARPESQSEQRRPENQPPAQPDSSLEPEVPRGEVQKEEDEAEQVQISELPDAYTVALLGLLFLATVYTLKLANTFLVPIALSLMLDFLLSPLIRKAKRIGIPAPLSATLVMIALFASVGLAAYNLAGPAAEWIQRAPQSLAKVEAKLAAIRPAVEEVTRAAEEVQSATAMGAGQTQTVEVAGPSLIAQVFGGTMDMFGFLGTVAFLTYFLLAAGDFFLLKLIRVLPHISDRKKAVNIARSIESDVSTYMVTTTLINLGVGITTAAAMWACEMPNPILWGVVAAVLNFLPFVGGAINLVVLTLAALLTFDSLGRALIPPAIFLLLNVIESNWIAPYVLGKRLQLNNVAVFVGMLFWAYIWGVPGALLAVPMMVVVKIIADNTDSLRPVSEFLGE
ncbi:MAG TPA: AI-2E family transporter [Candidatus Binatia bacterium]|nr:AI-2E family transporter [Candidatus Binatia bacterium]